MEVAKVLFAKARLLVDFDGVSRKRRGLGVIGGERVQYPFRRLSSASVWRGEEVEGIIGPQEGAELAPCFGGLSPSFWCEFYSMIGRSLVDFSVFWFRFGASGTVGEGDNDDGNAALS